MKIHYFQRYHQKENVATANTMLLLSRLYSFSPDKFFSFLKSFAFPNDYEPEIVINIQERNNQSVPDAIISQSSFKIVVETKLTDWFYDDQLKRHLSSFRNEELKVLMTVSSEPMDTDKRVHFNSKLETYNKEHNTNIIHCNTTFENIAKSIDEILDDKDYEMQDILEDYIDYCYSDNLIKVNDSWKIMRMQLAGTTIDFNRDNDLYYHSAEHGFRPHDYLGLYNNKSVRYIGKISAMAIATIEDGNVKIVKAESGNIGTEQITKIKDAWEDGKRYGYDLTSLHRYFFVEKFYPTNFRKSTKYPPRGSRIFNLNNYVDGGVKGKSVQEIAEALKTKTWQ